MQQSKQLIRLSTIMQRFCSVLILMIPCSVIWFWVYFESNARTLSIARHRILDNLQHIETFQIVLATLFSLAIASILIYGIWHLRKLFKLFRSGTFFSEAAANHLHTFGLTLFISALLRPVTSVVLSALLTMQNPEGQKSIVVELGSIELFTIFIAGTFMAITWILREGNRLVKENAEFV